MSVGGDDGLLKSSARSLKQVLGRGATASLHALARNDHFASTAFRLAMRERSVHLDPEDRADFLAFCFAHRRRSHAQLLQDLWVRYELGDLRDGYFVEFGAHDGVSLSNTYHLERDLDWGGILAEPNPMMLKSLRRTRRATIDDRCVWSTSDKKLTLRVTGRSELSTLDEFWGSDRHADARSEPVALVEVATVSLQDLLDQHDAPEVIDYCSVDTEGSEYEILRAFSSNERTVRLLTVEHNDTERRAAIDGLMRERGYELRFPELSAYESWYRRVA